MAACTLQARHPLRQRHSLRYAPVRAATRSVACLPCRGRRGGSRRTLSRLPPRAAFGGWSAVRCVMLGFALYFPSGCTGNQGKFSLDFRFALAMVFKKGYSSVRQA